MTNLLQALQFTLLVTNTTYEYEKEYTATPCPDKDPCCLVYHGTFHPKDNPTYRDLLTLVKEITRTVIPKINFTNDVEKVIRETRQREVRAVTWVPEGEPVTFTIQTNIAWTLSGTNVVSTNIFWDISRTNIWLGNTNSIISK